MRKIKIAIFLAVLITVYLGLFNTHLFASFNKFNLKDVVIETTSNSIQLEWGNISDEYVISINDKPYVETSKNYITISDLKPGYPYELVIEAKEKNNILDTFVIQTTTILEETQLKSSEYELEEGYTTAIFNESEAKIIFNNVPDDDKTYVVEKDDKELGAKLNGNKNYIIDRDLEPETKYRYSLVGKVKLNNKEKEKAKNHIKEKGLPQNLINVNLIEKEYELARTIETLKQEIPNQANAESWDDFHPGAEFIYTTYIPMATFKFAPRGTRWTTDYEKFHGDDRANFDPYVMSEDYRTRTRVRVSFPASGGSKVRFNAQANKTKGFNKHTKKWVSKKADMSDVYLQSKSEYADLAVFKLFHNARNPLHDMNLSKPFNSDILEMAAPGITYEYRGEVYKNGYFKIVGVHDYAPNHELSYTPVPGETHTYNGNVIYSTMSPLFTSNIAYGGFNNLLGPPVFPQKAIKEEGYWK